MISLKQVTYILAVEKTLHFKKAAALCAVSQSALSTAVIEMERQLGFQIFERDNKKVFITPMGAQCLAKAREIKMRMDDMQRLGQDLAAPLSYPLSIGTIPTIGPYLLPTVLPTVRHQYPGLQLRIVEEQSQVLVDRVRNGDLDAAIMALPYPIEGLIALEFWQEDFYLIAHRDDPLTLKEEITAAELETSRLMLLKDGHCLKDHALAACKLQAHVSDTSLASTSLNTLIQMVAGRMGTTLIPAMAVKSLLAGNLELKAAHLNEAGPHRRIAFVVRPNYPGTKNIELLIQLFRQALGNAPNR